MEVKIGKVYIDGEGDMFKAIYETIVDFDGMSCKAYFCECVGHKKRITNFFTKNGAFVGQYAKYKDELNLVKQV